MSSILPRFTIRMSPAMQYKIRYMADFHDRSSNREIVSSLKKHIAAFEAEHGTIEVPVEQLSKLKIPDDLSGE